MARRPVPRGLVVNAENRQKKMEIWGGGVIRGRESGPSCPSWQFSTLAAFLHFSTPSSNCRLLPIPSQKDSERESPDKQGPMSVHFP